MNYIEVFFRNIDDEFSEILTAELTMLQYEPFWQDENGLRAYVDEAIFNADAIDEILSRYKLTFGEIQYSFQHTKPDEWDRVKEEFEPFFIGDDILVKCNNVLSIENAKYELILDAQMAFGSGKHPSTNLCLQVMLDINFAGKTVLDVGTGSGVLAIMAEKMGATKIDAFDNNPWAIEVANKLKSDNNCELVNFFDADIDAALKIGKTYDVVLANLNMDVLRTELSNVFKFLNKGAVLLISGLMKNSNLSEAASYSFILKRDQAMPNRARS